MTRMIVGVDDRLADDGTTHPWRVVAIGPKGAPVEVVMSLPTGRRYYAEPTHPLHGVLISRPIDAEAGMRAFVSALRDRGVTRVDMADIQRGRVASCALEKARIAIAFHHVPIVPEDEHEDPYGIGDRAGHEIGVIERSKGEVA